MMVDVAQVSVLGLVFFNIFMNYIDNAINSTLSEFADNTKLSGAVEGMPSKGTCTNVGRNRSKCTVLQWVGAIPDMSTD